MNKVAIPQFTAEASLYKSSGSYFCETHSSAAALHGRAVGPATVRSWFRDRAYEVAGWLERNRDAACRSAAAAAGAGAAGACAAANPANVVGCANTGAGVADRAYAHCMAD
jgi:hypothetical protein